MKACSICGITKPLDEFYRSVTGKYGRKADCKACRKASVAQWQRENPAKHREVTREWARKKRSDPEWRKAKNERLAQWREANPDKEQARAYRQYHANPALCQQRTRQWYRQHPEVAACESRARRARKAQSSGTVSVTEWTAICASYAFRCVYCGKKSKELTQDHVIPLSKGGLHTADNVVPACRPCNSGKKDKTAPMFQRALVLS